MAILVKKPRPLVFLHIPKTGGTSVSQWLARHAGGKMVVTKHCKLPALQRYLKCKEMTLHPSFTVVRNPWDRLVSTYFYYHTKNALDSPPFKEWLMAGNHQYAKTQQYHFGNIDYVMHFSRLQEDFKQLQTYLNIWEPLPHVNASQHSKYISFYDRESQEYVAERYKKDIETFGFVFGE